MPLINNIKNFVKKNISFEKEASLAYNLWSETYDEQPGNLVLDLDEEISTKLFYPVDITNKSVADIGCGTGRHWEKIFAKQPPAQLTGFDVSEGMLQKLKQKYPQAQTWCITDNLFKAIPDASFDIIISTLTIAHIQRIDEALNAWSRILKKNGEIIITDFHPAILAKGGKRTFVHNKKQMAVHNYIHSIEKIKSILQKNNFSIQHEEEKYIDESVKNYYISQNALHVYERFKGLPVIYGLHLKRSDGTK